MTFPFCSCKKSRIVYVALVILFAICGGLFGYGLLPIIFETSLVSILFTVFFVLFSKQHPIDLVENIMQDETPVTPHQQVLKLHTECDLTMVKRIEEEEDLEVDEMDQIQDYLANKSADLYSEIESTDQLSTIDESDIDWPCSGRSQDFSDGSISDEESLIEIAITGGQYVVHPKDEDNKLSLQQKFPNFLPNDIFRQHGLREFFSEFNEEDNLIEIDISMGSIKCSRFEIEA